jgi:uncharacterized tellurite resistance protein B-like protein
MSILLALVAAIGTIGVILWRLQSAAEAARGLAETADEARGLFRRWGWRRKFAADPLDLIKDPREAAAAMMVALAQSDGAMTERERRVILQEIVRHFEATSKQAEELLAHSRWLVREVRDLDRCFLKLSPLIQHTCSPDQVRDILAMLENVAASEPQQNSIERDAVARFARAIR